MAEPQTLVVRFMRQDGLEQHAQVEAGKQILLGRDVICDVRLDGRKVSRRHLRLESRSDGIVVVADAGSHNGTFVNGARVDERGVSVVHGDLVTAGEWEGRVELSVAMPSRVTHPPVPMIPIVGAQHSTSSASSAQTAGDFDGVTDPSFNKDKQRGAPKMAAPQPRIASMPMPATTPWSGLPAQVNDVRTMSGPQAPPPSSQALQTRVVAKPATMVLPMSMRIAEQVNASMNTAEWGWEDAPASPEATRVASVDDNPIVKRFAETSTQLDFRGLSDLPQLGDNTAASTLGMKAPAQAIDGIALRLVFKVTEALQSTDSMDDFLREMCEQLAQAARAKGVVVLLPDERGQLVPRTVKQRRADEKIQLSRTVIDYVVVNKASLTTEDASADERFARGESVLRFDLKAVLCVPLVKRAADGAQGDVIGVVYLTRDLPFTNTERDLVAALAHLIAMGLERTRLREEFAAAERTRRSLERFHAPDVVRRLMMESSGGMQRDGLFLEPLTATVLFCDLAGFTTFCEHHEPEQVGTLLNSYLGTMTETVFAHGGTVDKFIGDAVMCIFGAPFSSADDALRGVRCAIDMRRNFRALVRSGAVGDDARSLDVHIGVNTGKVVAGTVGSPRRMEYTALGDTVNTAARLEGVAKTGQIVVGPTTASLVRGEIMLRPMGAHQLKGKNTGLELFEVPDE